MKTSMIPLLLVLYPFVGGLICWLIGRNHPSSVKVGNNGNVSVKRELYRDILADFFVITEFILMIVLFVQSGTDAANDTKIMCYVPEICGMGLSFTVDGFRLIYGTVAALMWMMTTILSRQYFIHHENRTRFYLFLLLTLGATMGVFLSADLFTTFIFFEIMSFTSYVWVAQEETKESLRAAATYLAVAVLGGLVMLMGVFLLYHMFGTLEIDALHEAINAVGAEHKGMLYSAGVCLLVGFGAKAGAFPLHIWLPKAHPVAPAPASALLSGILTKTGIFGVLLITSNMFLHDSAWGTLILTIGVLTMFGGAVLAVFSIDLKRTLACSSMSQIGFILVGVGMQGLLAEENALAVHGTMLHMINHSLIKLVLFMAAGVIFMNAHALDLNKIRGFGRKKPLLKGIFLTGALAIGGVPFFGGYISKTLIHESIVEYGGDWMMHTVEYLFLFSGGLTVAYITKLFVAIFLEKNENQETQSRYDKMKKYMNWESTFALAGSALILLIWGLFPHSIMDRVAEFGQSLMRLEETGHEVSYFSLTNLSGALISIVIGVLVYLFIRRFLMRETENGTRAYVDIWPKWLDLENVIYRPVLMQFLPFVCGIVCRIFDSFLDLVVVALRKTVYRDSPLPHELSEGNFFTTAAGKVMNFLQDIANRIWRRKNPVHRDYVHILAVKRDELKENNMIIKRSLSFGLLLFCIGLCLTLLYIVWW